MHAAVLVQPCAELYKYILLLCCKHTEVFDAAGVHWILQTLCKALVTDLCVALKKICLCAVMDRYILSVLPGVTMTYNHESCYSMTSAFLEQYICQWLQSYSQVCFFTRTCVITLRPLNPVYSFTCISVCVLLN